MVIRNKSRPVAVLDIGSNSVRLDIRTEAHPAAEAIVRRKSLCRLGKDMTIEGDLSKTRMEYTLKTLKKFKKIIEGNEVDRIKAVATAAVRSARNKAQFIEMIRKSTGIDVEVVDGDEEARLVAEGVIHSLSFTLTGLVADLGGGSLELIRVDAGQMKERTSLPLGIHRIPDTSLATRQMIWNQLDQFPWLKKSGKMLVAVGGTWRACARLDIANLALPLTDIHEYLIDGSRVSTLCDWVITGAFEKSKAQSAIEKHRRKDIPLAAFMMKTLHAYCHQPSVLFSQAGIREGCLVDLMREGAHSNSAPNTKSRRG